MKKQQEKNRFAHLAKEVEAFKTGKSMLKVTTTSLRTLETSSHYESYQQMRARHQKKGQAALEFKRLRRELKLTQGKLA